MLRDKLVEIALQWQSKYGVAPQSTSVISEFDAAMLVGMSESDYSDYMQDKTAVSKGADFVFNHQRYQVKANSQVVSPEVKSQWFLKQRIIFGINSFGFYMTNIM